MDNLAKLRQYFFIKRKETKAKHKNGRFLTLRTELKKGRRTTITTKIDT